MELAKQPIGRMAFVTSVQDGVLTAKFSDLGIFPGQPIKVVFKAPLGDPIAIEVEGTVVSLRLDEASWIRVK
jgi:Fe2+ transport system protein FeoA